MSAQDCARSEGRSVRSGCRTSARRWGGRSGEHGGAADRGGHGADRRTTGDGRDAGGGLLRGIATAGLTVGGASARLPAWLMRADPDELPRLVQRWSGGDPTAFDRLVSLLYDDLRRLAHSHLQRERPGHTLSTTALVHDVYVQLAERTGPVWQGRAQFFALVSRVMRNVLVDYARRRNAGKRGGGD